MNTKIPALTQTDLLPWFNKLELVNDCVAQVQKDLGMYGINLEYSGDPIEAYRELFSQLHPQIEKLLHRHTALLEILYRVDVSESKIKEAVEGDESFAGTLTRLILWRELQKVVTRFIISRQ